VPIRILFVDDEPNVLAGLRRMLHPMREEWRATFAGSGREAIDIMNRESQDVVVSDMRMPGMDGAELLTEVLHRWPQTVRLILSGQAEENMILRSIGPSHQYLTKPCEPAQLRSTIERTVALNALLSDQRLKAVVSQVDSLPSVPQLLSDVMEELRKPNCSLRIVGEIVSRDVGMTAKILRLVNSALFGLRREVTDPAMAVSYTGLNTVTALVLTCQVFKCGDEEAEAWFRMDRLWRHSMRAGQMAKTIAASMSDDRTLIDDCFTSGLLHDAGTLVLASSPSIDYRRVVEKAEATGLSIAEVEKSELGVTHAEVGAYLMGLWGLPTTVVEALAYHHTPRVCVHRGISPLLAVHVSCALDSPDGSAIEGADRSGLDISYLRECGVAGQLDAWQKLAETDSAEESSSETEDPVR
jgi:HD-like signal output (HDOD) protein